MIMMVNCNNNKMYPSIFQTRINQLVEKCPPITSIPNPITTLSIQTNKMNP